MAFFEFLLYPLYVAFFYFIFKSARSRMTDPILKYYHAQAFWIKALTVILFAFFNAILSPGDSYVLYHVEGKNIYDMILKDSDNFKWVIQKGSEFDETLLRNPYNRGYFRVENNYMVVRFVTLISFFTLGKYLLTNLVFSMLAFTGAWKLFEFFYEQYPHLHRKFAIAIFYLPTFVFWSSGVLKDSICIGSLGWITWSLYQLFYKKEKIIRSFFALVIFSYFLWTVKPYILISYVPFFAFYLVLKNINLVNSKTVKLLLAPSLIVGCIFAFSIVMSRFKEEMGQYSVDVLTDNMKKQNDAYEAQAYKGGANFSYGIEFDGSVGSLLKLAPLAVATTFFRPFIWESRKITTLLSSFEGMVLLFFTLSVFFKAGLRTVFQTITRNPLVLYCFLFAIIFALFVGATTLNFGTLCRYKIPCMPFYVIAIFLIQDAARQKKESLLNNKQAVVL
jgi:hypothetical protein